MFGWLASRGLENVLFSDEICSSSTKITICDDLGWNFGTWTDTIAFLPDLDPMDYSIWSILESNACNRSHKSIESLKRSLVQEWENSPGGPMCRCRRLGRENIGCHQNTGRYIEYQILLYYCNITSKLCTKFQ